MCGYESVNYKYAIEILVKKLRKRGFANTDEENIITVIDNIIDDLERKEEKIKKIRSVVL